MKIELDFKPISKWDIEDNRRAFLVVTTGDICIGYKFCNTFHQNPGGYRVYPTYFAPMITADPKDFEITQLKEKIKELEEYKAMYEGLQK